MSNKKYSIHTFVVVLVTLGFSTLVSAQQTFRCSDAACLTMALKNATAGDEIILAPGNYKEGGLDSRFGDFARFTTNNNGQSGKPITLRGSDPNNKPVIDPQRDGYSGGYGFSLANDYWILKDLEISGVGKGLMLDDANHCQLIGLEVHDIGQEAIHMRRGSSNTLIQNCRVYDTGNDKPGFGEGIYVGSDRASHSKFAPVEANNTIIENCTFGPDIRAEAFDIKEGTDMTIIRNNTFDATGNTGENSGDSFIDLKGINGFVYNNTFNVPNTNTQLASIVDVSNRTTSSYNFKTGSRSAIFDNTINLTSGKSSIPTARVLTRGPNDNPTRDIHVWENNRIPDSPWIKDRNTEAVVSESCPSWNVVGCRTLSIFQPNKRKQFNIYPQPANDHIFIGGMDRVSKVTMYTLHGSVIQEFEKVQSQEVIGISNISAGTYLISIESGGQSESQLLSIQR